MQLEEVPAGTVVVGVDGSASSREALHWAIDQAMAEGRQLTVVHAVGPIGTVWTDQNGMDSRTGLADTTPLLEEGHQILEDACAEARRTAPGLEVHDVLRVADPRDVLITLTGRAETLVVGSRGRGPVRSLLLGSVSMAVVRHTTCPVVVIRPSNQPLERHGILAGVHTPERSSGILRFAFRQASRRRLPLTVLHTFLRTRPPTDEPDAHATGLTEVIRAVQEDYPDVEVHRELVYGLPGESLLQGSAGMNMVVVGTSSGGPPANLLFGSIAAFVVEHTTCAVAVVPVGDPG